MHNTERVSEARDLVIKKIPRYIAYAGIAVLVIAGYQGCNNWRVARQEARAKQEQIAAARNTFTPPTQNPWSSRTISIPREGVIVYLYPGWADSPLGGAITITPVDGSGKPTGPSLHDAPGEMNTYPYQGEGNFLIKADPPGSPRKVQIYNKW